MEKEEKKSKLKKCLCFLKKYAYIPGWISLILGLFAANYFSNNNLDNSTSVVDNSQIGLNNNEQVSNASNINIGNDVDYEISNIENNYYGIVQIESLKSYANNCFLEQNYKGTKKALEAIIDDEEDVIAITNLGFLYANGLGTEKDKEKACELYDAAITLGYNRAYSHKLALLMRERSIYRAGCLRSYYLLNNEKINNFIDSNINEVGDITKEQLFEMPDDELAEYIDNRWYIENFITMNKYPVLQNSTPVIRYELLGTSNFYNDNDAITGKTFVYNIYEKECNNIELLKEKYIFFQSDSDDIDQ